MEKMLKLLGGKTFQGEWNLCKDKLPGMPPKNKREEYLCLVGREHYMIIGWCGGWNCSYNLNGTINRKAEIKDVIAWMPIPRLEIEWGEDDE